MTSPSPNTEHHCFYWPTVQIGANRISYSTNLFSQLNHAWIIFTYNVLPAKRWEVVCVGCGFAKRRVQSVVRFKQPNLWLRSG